MMGLLSDAVKPTVRDRGGFCADRTHAAVGTPRCIRRLRRTAGASTRGSADPTSTQGQVELLLERNPAKLLLGTRLDLPHTLLGDTQLAAELLKRLLVGTADPVPADQDAALTGVEPAEHPLDDFLTAAVLTLLHI